MGGKHEKKERGKRRVVETSNGVQEVESAGSHHQPLDGCMTSERMKID